MNEIAASRTVAIEKELPHAPEKIWRALTQPELMAEWLLKSDFLPVVGRKFSFGAEPQPHWNGIIDCEVLIVEPNKRLSYTWVALGLESVVAWTLVATKTGTLLRMEHSGFSPDQEANYRGAKYGWHKFIDGLERVIAGSIDHDTRRNS